MVLYVRNHLLLNNHPTNRLSILVPDKSFFPVNVLISDRRRSRALNP